MTASVHVRARIEPWDDPGFVHAYEGAKADVERSGCCPDGLEAASRVQQALHQAGYPDAIVRVDRTVEEALQHICHWTVRRDG